MSEDLREEIARAIAASLKDFYDNDGPCFALFLKDADAILPIVERVREEARESGYYQGVDEGYKRACLNRQSPF